MALYINENNLKNIRCVGTAKRPWYFDKQGSREIYKSVLHYDNISLLKYALVNWLIRHNQKGSGSKSHCFFYKLNLISLAMGNSLYSGAEGHPKVHNRPNKIGSVKETRPRWTQKPRSRIKVSNIPKKTQKLCWGAGSVSKPCAPKAWKTWVWYKEGTQSFYHGDRIAISAQ